MDTEKGNIMQDEGSQNERTSVQNITEESFTGRSLNLLHTSDKCEATALLAGSSKATAEGERGQRDNSTASRKQRETYDRERRLIPYMTYYIAPSLTTRTNTEARGVFVPIASPRANVYQIQPFSKLPLAATQTQVSQQIQILPKHSLLASQNPSLLPSEIQATKDSGIFPQIYAIGNQYADSGVTGPSNGVQVQTQRIQSESRPIQVIKVNPVTTDHKFTAPQFIKVIPIITKLPSSPDRSPKSFTVSPHPYSYSKPKLPPTPPESYTINDQNYHKEHIVLHNQNTFQGNNLYANQNPPKDGQLAFVDSTIASDKNKYTLAKIILSTTTPSPYTDVKFKVSEDGTSVVPNVETEAREHLKQLGPISQSYNRGPGLTADQYVTIPSGRQQIYLIQKGNGDISQESQQLLHPQNSQLPKLRVPLEEKIRFVATVTPPPVTNDLESAQWKIHAQTEKQQNFDQQALQHSISALLKETNKLPQNLTPHNIDEGIKTLALILERLQQRKGQHAEKSQPLNSSTLEDSAGENKRDFQNPKKVHSFPEKSGTSTPGRPGIDYPVYSSIPQTNFDCSTQRYKGFFGDPDTNCQVWHYCDLNGGQASFLCPNGTIFSQVALTCDWWFNVKCASTSQLYVLNERLYKYILPFSPSFPEDYSGPVVDTYLEAKFKEMEAKSRKKGGKSSTNSTTTEKPETTTNDSTEPASEYQTLGGEV